MCASTISKPSIPPSAACTEFTEASTLRKLSDTFGAHSHSFPKIGLGTRLPSQYSSVYSVYTTVSRKGSSLVPRLSVAWVRGYKGSCLHTEVVSLVFCTRRTTRHASVPSYECTCSTGGTLPRFQALSSASRRKIRRKARALEPSLFFSTRQ